MSPQIEKIKTAIEALAENEYNQLRKWFSEKDWKKWDKQIENDSDSGELDFLVKEASEQKKYGKLKKL